jgi:hypothetical protein
MKRSGRQRNPTPTETTTLVNSGRPTSASGLDYPLASLAARPPLELTPGARSCGFETLAGARSSTTEDSDGTMKQNPTSATTGPGPQRPEAERRRRDATATPRLRKPRLSLTLTDRPARVVSTVRSLLDHLALTAPQARTGGRP